jgi:hypothetical protein
MKSYKLILIGSSILLTVLVFIISSIEIPAPNKQINKPIDVNDVSVK